MTTPLTGSYTFVTLFDDEQRIITQMYMKQKKKSNKKLFGICNKVRSQIIEIVVNFWIRIFVYLPVDLILYIFAVLS